MAKRTKIEISGKTFKSQKDAISFVRDLLLSLESGGFVGEDSEHWYFFSDLLARHPDYTDKFGVGISKFLIGRNTKGDIELNLRRVDNSFSDVSWIKCVTGRATPVISNLKAAMRVEVDQQISKYKSLYFRPNMVCELCMNEIDQLSDCNADHIIHFDTLATDFIYQNPDHPKEFDDQQMTNKAMFKIADRLYADTWASYHQTHAKLRLVHMTCNLKREKARS